MQVNRCQRIEPNGTNFVCVQHSDRDRLGKTLNTKQQTTIQQYDSITILQYYIECISECVGPPPALSAARRQVRDEASARDQALALQAEVVRLQKDARAQAAQVRSRSQLLSKSAGPVSRSAVLTI